MQKLRRLLPVVRATAVIGAVMGLVTAVSFAALQSNSVALSPNTLSSATADLQIGSNAEAFSNTSVAGMTATLVPGVPSAPFTFYLKNNGQSNLNITANIPTDFVGSAISPSDVTLSLDCGSGPVAFTLAAWAAGSAAIPGNPLTAGSTWTCTETATLSSGYGGAGGQTVKLFDVRFIGNQ